MWGRCYSDVRKSPSLSFRLYFSFSYWIYLLGNDHEFLEGKATAGMRTAVEDVLEGHREDIWLLGSGKIGDVGIERNAFFGSTGFCNCQAHTKDGVGTQLGLVGSAIELFEKVIDRRLVLDVDVFLDDSGSDDFVHILDGLQNTCKKLSTRFHFYHLSLVWRLSPFPSHLSLSPSRSSHASCWPFYSFVSVTGYMRWEFSGKQPTCGSTRWDNSTVETRLGDNVDFDSGVSTRVVDRASMDLGDGHSSEQSDC